MFVGWFFLGNCISHDFFPPLIPLIPSKTKSTHIIVVWWPLRPPKKHRVSVKLNWKHSLMRWTNTHWRWKAVFFWMTFGIAYQNITNKPETLENWRAIHFETNIFSYDFLCIALNNMFTHIHTLALCFWCQHGPCMYVQVDDEFGGTNQFQPVHANLFM